MSKVSRWPLRKASAVMLGSLTCIEIFDLLFFCSLRSCHLGIWNTSAYSSYQLFLIYEMTGWVVVFINIYHFILLGFCYISYFEYFGFFSVVLAGGHVGFKPKKL